MDTRSKYKIAKVAAVLMGIIMLLQYVPVFALVPPGLPIEPTDTQPPVPVADSAIRRKEVGEVKLFGITIPGASLDSIVINIVRALVDNLSDKAISYINNGFHGGTGQKNGPQFATDLEGYLLNVGDAVAGNIIEGVVPTLCTPFQAQIRGALSDLQKTRGRRNSEYIYSSCPLSSVSKNIDSFLNGDFVNGGGWDAWFALTQTPNGNPYSVFINTQAQIDAKTESAQQLQQQQINWGNGFLATQKCAKLDPTNPNNCVEYEPVKTPGVVVQDQLEKVFGSEVDQLNIADEFDEMVGALIGQLADTVFNPGGIFNNTGGNYTRNRTKSANQDTFGSCFADKSDASFDDNVTWTFAGSTGGDLTYEWNLGDGLTSTDNPAVIKYSTQGQKTASVKVTKTTQIDENTAPIVKTDTIQCQGTVNVSRYKPLAASCTVDPTGTSKENSVVTWTIKVTGGSGQLHLIDIDSQSSFQAKESEAGTMLYWYAQHISPVPPALQNFLNLSSGSYLGKEVLPLTQVDGAITFSLRITYEKPGLKNLMFATIADNDNYVQPLSGYACDKSITIVP